MAQMDIMVSRHSAFYSPLISAIAAGFLADEGLEPAYSIMGAGKTTIEAVADGTVHVGQASVAGAWGAMEASEASPVVHFAQINERDGFFIAARESDRGFSWDRLAGKTVLVDHATQPLAMFKYAVHREGVDFDAIKTEDAGDTDEMDRAFRDGRGDYVHQQGPYPQQLEKDGFGYVVASVGKAVGPVAFSSLVATREWLITPESNAFMRAYRKARNYVNETSAAEIAQAEASFFPEIDQDVLTTTIEFYQGLGTWNPTPAIDRAHYEAALDVFLHSGEITKRHPYDEVVALPPAD